MSNREMAIDLMNNIPDSELLPIVDLLKMINRFISQQNSVEEIEPDEWDLRMIAEAEKENDGTTISLEELAKDLNLNV